MTPTHTPYLNTCAAQAVARRIEKKGLLDLNWWVQLLPVCLPDTDTINYVLRYYVPANPEIPVAQLHFMETKRGGKSAAVVEELQKLMGWGYGQLKPNAEVLRHLPTLANTRRYKLQLLMEPA